MQSGAGAAAGGGGGGGALPVSKTDSALANLRARALDLHARLLELRDAVAMLRDGVGPARNAPWPAFLAQYQTLGKLFHQLTEELDRAVTDVGFQNFLLQPRAVADDPDLVPNMLRTKLEPDVERDVASRHAQYVRDQADPADPAAAAPSPSPSASVAAAAAAAAAPPADAPLSVAQTAALEKRILMFNAFVEGAMERLEDTRERVLSEPRPPTKPPPETTPRAQAALAAMASGAPLP